MSYAVGDKVSVKAGGRWHDAVVTKPPHKETGNYGVRFKVGTKTVNTVADPKTEMKTRTDEKVHTLRNPDIKPMGAPADKARAFDKVNARTGARKNRSVLKALEKSRPQEEYFALDVSEDPDYTMVLVMKPGIDSNDYYGVNVLFYPDGKVDASTGDSLADKQWAKDKAKIIKVARKQLKTDAPMGDLDRDVRAYHGAGDGDYHGYTDKKMNESKLSFKQFLLWEGEDEQYSHFKQLFGEVAKKLVPHKQVLAKMQGAASALTPLFKTSPDAEALTDAMNYFSMVGDLLSKDLPEKAAASIEELKKKHGGTHTEVSKMVAMMSQAVEILKASGINEGKKIKEPGWYVVDHMDKPVDGPMQERGAKELADEMNEKHAGKHGKGDIAPYSAEYFTDYEIRRMNESAELTAAQKKALLDDFEEWSGGFTPDDCDEAQVKKYIKSGMSTDLPKEAAVAYLKYIADNGARNAP